MKSVILNFKVTKDQARVIKDNAKRDFGGNLSLYLRTVSLKYNLKNKQKKKSLRRS